MLFRSDLPGVKIYLERKGELPQGLVFGLAAIITYYKGETAKKSNPQPFFSPKSRKWRKKSIRRARGVVLSGLALSVTAFAVPPLPKGEARARPEAFSLYLVL